MDRLLEILCDKFKTAPNLGHFISFLAELIRKHKMDNEDAFKLSYKYTELEDSSIKLEMLVPCKDGEVLEEPPNRFDIENYRKRPLRSEGWDNVFYREKREYQEAKEKVLFDGFEAKVSGEQYVLVNEDGAIMWVSWNKSKTISDLIGQKITKQFWINFLKKNYE